MAKFLRLVNGKAIQQDESASGGFQTNGSGTRLSPTTVTAASTITVANLPSSVLYIRSNSGLTTMTANPQLTTSGISEHNILIVRGSSDALSVTFVNGNGLALKGSCTLGAKDSLMLMFDGAEWVEIGRS